MWRCASLYNDYGSAIRPGLAFVSRRQPDFGHYIYPSLATFIRSILTAHHHQALRRGFSLANVP